MTLKQFFCGLMGGHDRLIYREGSRMSLRCVGCGHETPGWNLNLVEPVAPEKPRLSIMGLDSKTQIVR
jgi:hypothetical protein